MALVFYFAPGSSSMAVHIGLHEVGAAFEPRPVSLRTPREQRPAEFLAANPEGKVPTLVIDGRPLTEVAAILFWLARRFPEAGLLPGDAEGEAQAIAWMSFCAATLHPARRLGPEQAVAAWRVAEQKLGGREWALGRYSVADIHLFRLFWRFGDALGTEAGALPALTAHRERMLAREAVQRVLDAERAVGYELPA